MNASLPVYKHKKEIVDAILQNDTVIITAETGSGKSTQIPQYLYEAGFDVIVTQPRRLACVSLANHVAREMGEKRLAAYQTAFESNRSDNTHIIYCTDGLQLARGLANTDRTILILDEVHEWNLYMETLIAWVRYYRKQGHQIKVMIMSATLDANSLAEYYGGAVVINLTERSYPVKKFSRGKDEYFDTILECVSEGRNVLAFLTGKREIDKAAEKIEGMLAEKNIDAIVFQLHGSLAMDTQEEVFKSFDIPKIVLATNVAQTSLTIPDIDDVVDNGLAKIRHTVDGFDGLDKTPISRADCLQRAGRAGRTKPGRYFLCSDIPLEERVPFGIPEIQRVSLDKVILRLASVGIEAQKLQFFHMPKKALLAEAIDKLRLARAIDFGGITEIGKQLMALPIDIEAGLILLEAGKYGEDTMREAMICVAILQVRSLLEYGSLKRFYRRYTKRNDSDLLAEVEIFEKYRLATDEELEKARLNQKKMVSAREYFSKIRKEVSSIVHVNSLAEYDEQNIYRCIARGLLYGFSVYNGEMAKIGDRKILFDQETNLFFVSKKRRRFVSTNTSTTWTMEDELLYADVDFDDDDDSEKKEVFLVGVPRAIDRFKGENKALALGLPTVIPRDIMIDVLLASGIEKQVAEETLSYSKELKKFMLSEKLSFRGTEILFPPFEVHEGEARYDSLFQKYKNVVDSAGMQTVVINGSVRQIRKKEDKLFVYIPYDEIMDMEEDEIRNVDGNIISIETRNTSGERVCGDSISDLKNNMFTIGELFLAGQKRIYRMASGDMNLFSDLLAQTGERKVNGKVLYVGLMPMVLQDIECIKLLPFDDEEEATSMTQASIQKVFQLEVVNKYFNEDLFNEPAVGFTERSKQVYNGFKRGSTIYIAMANAKNFDETLAIIQKEYRNARIAVGQDPDECK